MKDFVFNRDLEFVQGVKLKIFSQIRLKICTYIAYEMMYLEVTLHEIK